MAKDKTTSGCIFTKEGRYRFIRDQWRNQFPALDYSGRWKGKNWWYFLSHDEPGLNNNESYIDAFETKGEMFAWIESQNCETAFAQTLERTTNNEK